MLQYKINIKKKKKKTYTLEPKKQNPQKNPKAKQKHKHIYFSTVRNIRAKVGQRNCQTPPLLPVPSYLQPASPAHPP